MSKQVTTIIKDRVTSMTNLNIISDLACTIGDLTVEDIEQEIKDITVLQTRTYLIDKMTAHISTIPALEGECLSDIFLAIEGVYEHQQQANLDNLLGIN